VNCMSLLKRNFEDMSAPKKTICTHNGTFHCDEAMACFMLKQTKQFHDAEIIRTRDQALIDQQDVVVDVGGVYDPSKHRYDHHQRGFFETLSTLYETKLSSAGLVYKHFGREVIKNILGTTDDTQVETVFKSVYDGLIESLDGIDNGIERYPSDIKPKYKLTTDLSSRVGNLNPPWNDPSPNPDERFKEAVRVAGEELVQKITYYGKVWYPARHIVEKALLSRFDVDPSGKIILLNQFCPWKEHLFDLEEEQELGEVILYALFGDTNGSWRVQCVSKKGGSFENRLSLPEQWRGLRDEELSKASGVPGCVFVHMSGFIGGNLNKEGALKMARIALHQGK